VPVTAAAAISPDVDAQIEAAVRRLRTPQEIDDDIEAAVRALRAEPAAAAAAATASAATVAASANGLRYCPTCGRRIDADDRFCAGCGRDLKAEAAAARAA
jgi:NADH pyrophosphatase NudC (nudix superfamily)